MRKYLIVFIILIMVITYISYHYRESAAVVVSDNITTINNIETSSLKILTYNIRHGRGVDDQVNLERIAGILKKTGADIIGLNEVDNRMKRSSFKNQVKFLADRLNMNYVFGPAQKNLSGSYGNAILTKYSIAEADNTILPVRKNSEKRALIQAKVVLPDSQEFVIMNTHLSLSSEERTEQLETIENIISKMEGGQYILMGDFNSDVLDNFSLLPLVNEKTYPSWKPEKAIDRFYSNINPAQIIKSFTIVERASDHLPVLMEIDFSADVS
ncbi:MAG: endonuclease/exonuclease/phosphatase family protein [Halothermotrichaceae bacterium]